MSLYLENVAEKLVEWAKKEPDIHALFWYGSYGYNIMTPKSDLDTAWIISSTSSLPDLILRLEENLAIKFRIDRINEGRITLWVSEDYYKIDIVTGTKPSDLDWLANKDDVPPPRLVLAHKKNSVDIGKLIERAQASIPEYDTKVICKDILNEINKFLVSFEDASAAHAKSDAYVQYFQYNLALGRLARLLQLEFGTRQYLYLPKNLLAGYMPQDLHTEFIELSGSLYLPDIHAKKVHLADFFMKTVNRLVKKFKFDFNVITSEIFLQKIIKRDLFYNVRDISTFFKGKIKEGVLIRSMALARWQYLDEFREWITSKPITAIIDLRNDFEKKPAYDTTKLEEIHYYPIPYSVGSKEEMDSEDFCYKHFKDRGKCYFEQAVNNINKIVDVFRIISNNTYGATVLHCQAGMDRTGFTCALLEMLLGMPVDGIIKDFISSKYDAPSEIISQIMIEFLDEVESYGGVEKLVLGGGMNSMEIETLKNVLLV